MRSPRRKPALYAALPSLTIPMAVAEEAKPRPSISPTKSSLAKTFLFGANLAAEVILAVSLESNL